MASHNAGADAGINLGIDAGINTGILLDLKQCSLLTALSLFS